MRISSCAVMAGAALALVGCSRSDFNTPELLNHVRILAMQAEPPQPSTGQSTTLQALVYQPPVRDDTGAQEFVTGYHWAWCPFATDSKDPSKCPVDQTMADHLFAGIPGVPPLDLGSNETATFTNPFPASVLAGLCQKNYSVLPALSQAVSEKGGLSQTGGLDFGCGIAGFPIVIQLVIDAMVSGESVQFQAIFQVFLPVNDAVAPNHNPVIGAINITDSNNNKYPIDESGTQWAARGAETPLFLDLPLSSSEALPNWQDVYLKVDPQLPANEKLDVYWLIEGGTLGANHQGGYHTWYLGGDPNDPVAPFDRAVVNYWNIPKVDKFVGSTARIYVVVVDKRSGVNWTTGVVRLVDTPGDRDAGASDGPPDAGAPPDASVSDASEDGEDVDAQAEVLP